MPDYTDPWLLPFPDREEYGAGAHDIEELARAVDPLLVAQDARITALATRPTFQARRMGDQAWVAGDPIVFNAVEHDNCGVVVTTNDDGNNVYATPEPGAHAVAGVYPAIWRVYLNVYFVASAPSAGSSYQASCPVSAYDPAEGGLDELFPSSEPVTDETEPNAGVVGGVYLDLNYCVALPSPGTFIPLFNASANGTFKAFSYFGLTRIRSV